MTKASMKSFLEDDGIYKHVQLMQESALEIIMSESYGRRTDGEKGKLYEAKTDFHL